jgi:hypothetical protein
LLTDKVGSEKMPYVGLKSGEKLWYEEKGRGMPIVLLHGWLGSSWDFSNQIDYFSKAYRVLHLITKVTGKAINHKMQHTHCPSLPKN